MADYTLSAKVTADSKQYQKAIVDAEKATERFKEEQAESGSKMAKAGTKMSNLVSKVKTLAASYGVLKTATAGITYNATLEQYQTSFEVMTGSAKKAADTVERLKKVAANTPFELPQLADTTQLLMNYGFTADEAINRMEMLGDIAQGNAEKMSRVAVAYGQMSSAGKVSLEDVKQMIEAGFNPLQEISEATGESMKSLYERISDGKIAVDEITASMQRSTSEGGKYFQSMEKQSQTLNGRLSTLKDTVNDKLGQAFRRLSDILRDKVIPKAIETVDSFDFNEATATVKKFLPGIKAIGITIAAWKSKKHINSMVSGFKKAEASVNLFTVGMDKAAISQKVLTGTLKTSEAAVGLLTSKLTLHQAATALAAKATSLFNITLEANPIGATIVLFSGLAAGILAVSGAFSDTSSTMAKYKEDLKIISKDMDSYKNKMEQLAETRKNILKDGMSELNYYQSLGDELSRLVDENGRVLEGYESRAGFIVTTLNDALGLEISMTGGVIQNYDKIAGSIDNVIEKKKAELILSAFEEEYVEALKNRATAIEAVSKQQELVNELEIEYQRALQAGSDERQERTWRALDTEMKRLAEYEQAVGENTHTINTYQDMQAAAAEGKTDAIIAGIGKLQQGYIDLTATTREELQKQRNDTQLALEYVVKKHEETGSELYKSDIEMYQKQLTALDEQLASMESKYYEIDWNAAGGYVVDGVFYGMNSKEYKVIDKARSLALSINSTFNKWLGIKSPSRVMAKSGKFTIMGLVQGIKKETPKAMSIMEKVAQSIIDKAPSAEMVFANQNMPHDFNARYASEVAYSHTLSGNVDIEGALSGIVVNVYSQTNVDGTPLLQKSADYTIKKINNQQRNNIRMRGQFI